MLSELQNVTVQLELDIDLTLFIPWDDSFREIQVYTKNIKDQHTLRYKNKG